MPHKHVSTQECFASDLAGTALGLALYAPIPFGCPLESTITEALGLSNVDRDSAIDYRRLNSGKVGDIAFFDGDGKYQWIRNAFHIAVRLPSYGLTIGIGAMELASIPRARDDRDSRNSRPLSNCRWRTLLFR